LALLDWEATGTPDNDQAIEALRRACVLRERLSERENLIESRACLAIALAANDPSQAQELAAAARADMVMSSDRPTLRQLVAYACYVSAHAAGEASMAREHLRAAAEAMAAAAEVLSADERGRFLQQIPLNRASQAALTSLSHQITARLVRADVPLGQPLGPGDQREVHWTLESPTDADIPQIDTRRRHVLRRLIEEAAAQGVAPTDTDLASALGVSRRTILRDIARLARQGITIATRRRR
ncbi:MAG: DUF1670 domain-containing protein, partial [Oscillochloris sp.]|nr:DUF1670 domain-containing protein [Oscillochloris sp.]